MSRKGGALPMVLLITTILVVIGFSMANLCMMDLNSARQFLNGTQTSLLAQAAVEHFVAEYEMASEKARQNGVNLQNPTPTDLGFRQIYASGEGLPQRQAPGMTGKVTVTFDPSQPYYSVDNSSGEYATAGWQDRGTTRKSVPPFTVDLVISVQDRHFEAFVSRRWPYVVFTAHGLIVLCATPAYSGTNVQNASSGMPTTVQGDVATLEQQPDLKSMFNVLPQLSGYIVGSNGRMSYGYLPLGTRLQQSATQTESTVAVVPGGAVSVGPTIYYTPKLGMSTTQLNDVGNNLQGNVHVPAVYKANDGPDPLGVTGIGFLPSVRVWPANTFSGQSCYADFPPTLTTTSNPVTDIQMPSPMDPSFKQIKFPAAPMPFHLLNGDLTVDPALSDQPPLIWGGGGSRYLIVGDVGNHYLKLSEPGVYSDVVVSSGRILLKNCILFVAGNLDLSGSDSGIQGSNATLIVSGTLNLSGGRLDSSDQGMVIFANEVITRAKGDYRGLMMAQQSMMILPPSAKLNDATDVLNIRGALLCGGDSKNALVLRSTNVTYDAASLKSVHNYGQPIVSMWREI